jgi:soluble lytic murein transglycosylase-like protein
MNSEFGITTHPPPQSGEHGGRVQRRCLASRFAANRRAWLLSGSASKTVRSRSRKSLPGAWQKIIKTRLILLATLVIALFPVLATAKLAVFVDGRVLKVDDARLEGSEIVLDLRGGGSLRVPALRIDRVIADEVEEDIENDLEDPDCPFGWTDEELPKGIPFQASVRDAARSADLHPWLVAAVVQTESAFDPRAVSRVGAAGLMQLMPAAAADQEVTDVFDPVDNLRGGTAHLRLMLDRFESLSLALAAYNSGATTVERYKGIPPYEETRNYVRRVLEIFCPGE